MMIFIPVSNFGNQPLLVISRYPLPHVCRRLLKEGWMLITYLFTWNLIKGSYLLKFPSEILKNSDDCFITQKTYKPNNLNHISVCIRCTIASPMNIRGGNWPMESSLSSTSRILCINRARKMYKPTDLSKKNWYAHTEYKRLSSL